MVGFLSRAVPNFHIYALPDPISEIRVIGQRRQVRATGLTAITPEIETRQIRRAREREAAKRSSREIMR